MKFFVPTRMRSTWIVLAFVFVQSIVAAEILWVAPDGSDRNRGTRTAPFATLQRAQKAVKPGDTICVRGGVYKMTEAMISREHRNQAHVILLDRSGTEQKPIKYWAYPGEEPVFDFSEVKPRGLRVTAFHVSGSWIHLRGLSVRGVQVTISGHTQSICFDNQGNHNTYEMLKAHDGMAIGFWIGRGSHNLVLNCDAFRNHDNFSGDKKGGNVDGFGFHGNRGSVGNVFKGCRAWFNSDDGYDTISADESVIFDNCWALYNGTNSERVPLGDGNGFKIGGYGAKAGGRLPTPIPRNIIRQCLAVGNRASGFYANHHPGGNDWLNNSAYRNSYNFNMLGRDRENTRSVPGAGHLLKNNLGFRGRRETHNFDESICDASGNYFNLPVEVNERDFVSLDEAELLGPRQANGDLPLVGFMRLKKGSDLIDKGSDVGLPFVGKAPDLGAFEFSGE
jgi:hypothetical protein